MLWQSGNRAVCWKGEVSFVSLLSADFPLVLKYCSKGGERGGEHMEEPSPQCTLSHKRVGGGGGFFDDFVSLCLRHCR